MNISFAAEIFRNALLHAVIAAAPVLFSSLVVGLVIGIVQTTTSVQEQTLSFVPKILTIFTVLGLLGIPIMNFLVQYTRNMFTMIETMAR